MGRPLFHQDKGNQPLAQKEHPCVVLNTVQRNDLPGKPVMAVVIPMSHSKTSAIKPNHLDVKPYHTRNLSMDKKNKSYLCTDSPNVVVLNGENNGLRKAAFAPDWCSDYTHGRITDTKLLDAATALTKSFLKETGYDVPTQGKKEPLEKTRKRTEIPYDKRKAIVLKAAQAEAQRQSAGFLRLQSALRDIDVPGHTIPNAQNVPGFKTELAR